MRTLFIINITFIISLVSCQLNGSPKSTIIDDTPASCLPPNLVGVIKKIGTELRKDLDNYNISVLINPKIKITINQCFSKNEFILDPYSDPRINPRPESKSTFDDPAWRTQNYSAWETSVTSLRKPQYDDLEQSLGGAIIESRSLLDQKLVVSLSVSSVFDLLKRRDVFMVFRMGELVPPPN